LSDIDLAIMAEKLVASAKAVDSLEVERRVVLRQLRALDAAYVSSAGDGSALNIAAFNVLGKQAAATRSLLADVNERLANAHSIMERDREDVLQERKRIDCLDRWLRQARSWQNVQSEIAAGQEIENLFAARCVQEGVES